VREGTRKNKSDSPVDCRSPPAGRWRNHNFRQGRKCKRVPDRVPIKDGYFDRVTVLILFAVKHSFSGVFLTFERNIKNCSAIYAPI
jgi:hypothetical protein